MSRPLAHLKWFPDAADPLSVWAQWVGAGDHYTLRWGDGDSQRVLWNQPPVRHTYPAPGQYTLLAERGIAHTSEIVTAAATVVIRATLEPQATAALLDDERTVGVDLAPVADPMNYLIDWGDGARSEHATVTPMPTHTYPWEYGHPELVVRDQPSQRWATLSGPEIGPEPERKDPVPEWTFHHTFLPTGYESAPTKMKGVFYGRNLRPGARYGIRLNWTSDPGNYAWGVADDDGRAIATIPDAACWVVQSAQWYRPWRWCLAFEADRQAQTYHYVPITARSDGLAPDGELTVVYAIDLLNPRRVQLQVQKPQPGSYTVQWGDGHEQTVPCDGTVFCAWHTYSPTITRATATVTGPNDARGAVTIGTASITEPYVSRDDAVSGALVRTYLTDPTGDGATPIIVQWNDPRVAADPDMYAMPNQLCGLALNGVYPVDHWYPNNTRGQTIPISIAVPLRKTLNTAITIPPSGSRTVVDDGMTAPPIRLDGTPSTPGQPTLDVEWSTTTEWDGGYSGNIMLTNHGPRLSGWEVVFDLDEPGVLREVWPSTVQMREAGDGRWRVWSTTPLEPATTVTIGARIEPPGQPQAWPHNFVARPLPRSN